MKKTLSIAVVAIFIITGGLYFAFHKGSDNAPQTTQQSTTWKTYTNSDTGFTIKYPSQYALQASPAPISDWGSRTLFTIDDNPNAEQTSSARPIPVTVDLMRQPVALANGKTYHTVAEYQQSGVAGKMVQGATNPNGNIVTVNGVQALLYHFPPSDMTGIAGDSYFFVKNDLIYEVGINPSDPYNNEILQSISWNK